MKKKIVIIGALGYLGTELSKLYSGESWCNKIVAIDDRFVAERVSQLRNWGINFVHGDILDRELIKKYLNNVDVVHHLAGITDVARTSKESELQKDEKLNRVAIEGTENIISSASENCKIVFPSTHVVFEGIESTKQNINEEEPVLPVLAYSKSKIKNGGINNTYG